MMKKAPKRDDPDQSKRFEETARELGVDESGRKFKRAVKAVVPKKRRTAP
jgi:hypothetical protein